MERERSASLHATRAQNGKLCMRAKRNCALRRFRTEYYSDEGKTVDDRALEAKKVNNQRLDSDIDEIWL
eukprot:6212261-Pleurochrysis_carterae.AAC.2